MYIANSRVRHFRNYLRFINICNSNRHLCSATCHILSVMCYFLKKERLCAITSTVQSLPLLQQVIDFQFLGKHLHEVKTSYVVDCLKEVAHLALEVVSIEV